MFDLSTVDKSNFLGILIASDELLLDDELCDFFEDYLIKNQSNWINENCIEVLHTVYILPKHIISYHLTSSIPRYPNLPSRCNLQIDSSLLTSRQLRIIINWTRNEKNIDLIPSKSKYTFTLLYKASCDGFENNTFNEKCINQGSCFVVTKCNKTNRIVGGYTSVGFNYSYGYYNDPRSFLFSFDFNEIKNPIICCIQNYGHALYNNYYSGGYNNSIFNFGCGDLMMNNNCISCNGGSNNYKQLNLLNNNSNKFYASEIEAFKVQLNG
ncbi:15151_t:CDS:2 [Entrophospora sp. SA101]|nr:15151_t:CDS:2 [Entrophospora sp. SA101]